MSRRRDESGAVAVLVGLLAVFLVGMMVFVADFGMAYANKRQTQTAADAAALGAAVIFSQQAGASCDGIRVAGDAAANAEANAKVGENDDNMPNPATLDDYNTECRPDVGLVVETTAGTTSPSFFGGLFGGDDYALDRSAAAVVDAAGGVGAGLRPLAVCSRDLLPLTTFPTPVMKFEGPAGGGPAAGTHSDCPDTMNPGNWWTLRCPGDNSNLATNLANGCQNPVSLVPGQPDPGDPGLTSHLLGHCAGSPFPAESCLTSDPGNLRDSGSLSALRNLVDTEEMFFLPAFCGIPTCNPGAVTTDGGSNTIYPVFRLIAVRLCGYHLGNGASGSYSKMTGDCAVNPSGYNVSVGGAHRNYLLLTVLQTNVPANNAVDCNFGDPCDTGLRQVGMVG
jgi:hypothetical protein